MTAAVRVPGAPRCTAGQNADAAKAMVAIPLCGLPGSNPTEGGGVKAEGAGEMKAEVSTEV